MTFAVFCFMVLWVLLIIEGLNYEIIVLCSLVAISLTILSNFIIFIFEGKKTPSKLSFWERYFHSKKPSDCRILKICVGGYALKPPSQHTP